MGLTGSLIIGQSALAASQVALQITGNNLANAATPGYSRQRAELLPVRGQALTAQQFLGRGVQVGRIARLVEPSVQARLRASVALEQEAAVKSQVAQQLESILAELTDNDLSSQLQSFWDGFSELANTPDQAGTKSLAVEQGASLSSFVQAIRTSLDDARQAVETQLNSSVDAASEMLAQIAALNQAIVNAEQGAGLDGNLRDQRDALLDELAVFFDITVVEQPSGAVDVLVGSQPVLLGTASLGLDVRTRSTPEGVLIDIVALEPEETVLAIDGGSVGGLLGERNGTIKDTIDDLDSIAAQLIFEVNRLHSTGLPSVPLTSLVSDRFLPVDDRALAFNDPANETIANLPFGPTNGTFTVAIRDVNGGLATTTIEVDLDGIDADGAPGFDDDTSLSSLVEALDAIENLNATIGPDGTLRLETDAGFSVSFEDDSSGVLATLGVNSYFTGTGADDIAVRSDLSDNPSLLAVGLSEGTNEIALAISGLQDQVVSSLGERSISQAWSDRVQQNGVKAASAASEFEALSTVRASLDAQRASISGVSIDEESINLITYQQQYQAAARFVSVVNDLTQTLLTLV